jgi:hypothetical protein
MSVAERVGQLFLVTFSGDNPDRDAMITDLSSTITSAAWC